MVTQTHLPFQKATQRPMTTAHLAQTMTLLGLNNLELIEKIEGELAKNPALEIVEEHRCPSCKRKLHANQICPKCSYLPENSWETPIVFVSSQKDLFTPSPYTNDDFQGDDYSKSGEDLASYVLKQIITELDREEQLIAAHILSGLDEDGFCPIPLLEIARYHHVPVDKINYVIKKIQHCDPFGVGSANPKDALLAQVEILGESENIDPLLIEIINNGLDLLSRRQYAELGKFG